MVSIGYISQRYSCFMATPGLYKDDNDPLGLRTSLSSKFFLVSTSLKDTCTMDKAKKAAEVTVGKQPDKDQFTSGMATLDVPASCSVAHMNRFRLPASWPGAAQTWPGARPGAQAYQDPSPSRRGILSIQGRWEA